jgi:hypothetical protein
MWQEGKIGQTFKLNTHTPLLMPLPLFLPALHHRYDIKDPSPRAA